MLLVLSLFLPPHYLPVQMWCRPFQATCRLSLLLLLRHQYRQTVLTCLVHGNCCTRHRSIMPTSSVLHPSLWSAYYLYQLISAGWFWWDHLVCRRRPICCFLLSFLSLWHHTAPLSNSLWLISSSSRPRCAILVLLHASWYGCLIPSVLVSRRICPTFRS